MAPATPRHGKSSTSSGDLDVEGELVELIACDTGLPKSVEAKPLAKTCKR